MSHTFHEDEQRNVHFEEWDRVLDDHLDTVHALQAGVDPNLDWVWDDAEYDPIIVLIDHIRSAYRRAMEEFIRPIAEFLEKAVPEFTKVWDRLADAARSAVKFVTETVGEWREWSDHRAESLAPLSPPQIDKSRVTSTRTKPPKPMHVYRRRTP